jgi:penicillin G amidase
MPHHTPRHITAIGIGASLAVLAVVAGWAVWHVLTSSLPDTEGELTVEGLHAPVDIRRDQAGVPHILATNDADMYFAAGFVHAQDRLWQMDLMRRYGQGRLSEIFGSRAITTDRLMRTIGIARIADSLYRRISPLSRQALDAYARGVNAGINEARGRFPLEFDLLQYRPESWTPQHSLIILRLMGWELALSWWVDLTLADLVATLGEEKARTVFPVDDTRGKPFVTAPPAIGAMPAIDTRALRGLQQSLADTRALLAMHGSAIGSNAWAVTGSRSTSGAPVLANDPHLMHAQPARWYAMHMATPDVNVAGVSLPGVPGIVIGHTDSTAWGLTALMADDVDFAVERISLRDSTWELRGTRRPLIVRTDSIFVRDSIPVLYTWYETGNGVVIDDVHPAWVRRPVERIRTSAMSMRWTGAAFSDEILTIYRLNRSRTVDDMVAALATHGVPAQNVVVADRSGRIGTVAAGLIPLRSVAAAELPAAGWDGSAGWSGFVAFEKLPRVLAPPGEVVATANNRIAHTLPTHISSLWESDARIDRITQIIAEQRQFGAPDMRLMQMDMQSTWAAPVRDALVRALVQMPGRSIELTRAMNLLAQWDLRMTPSSGAAAVFNASLQHLVVETFRDEMGGTLFRNWSFIANIPTRTLPRMLADTSRGSLAWFDNVRTAGVETRDDILRKSVMLGLLDLTRRLGTDMGAWTWGALHTVTFRHPLGELPAIGRLLNVGPLAIGGASTTINNGEFRFGESYDAVVGPSMRLIVDLAAPDTSLLVLPTGQSGQPLSRHYADQAALWQNGAYHKLVSNVAAVRAAPWETLRLLPE